MDYSKFDKMYDASDLAKAVVEREKNGGNSDFEKVPHGTYEVKVTKLEMTESKSGKPMVTVWFKVLAGEHKNGMIFMNQLIEKDFQIHIVNSLLRSFDTSKTDDVGFESYKQYADLLCDIAEAIEAERLEYSLEYGEKKGYDTFTINEVFESEN